MKSAALHVHNQEKVVETASGAGIYSEAVLSASALAIERPNEVVVIASLARDLKSVKDTGKISGYTEPVFSYIHSKFRLSLAKKKVPESVARNLICRPFRMTIALQ